MFTFTSTGMIANVCFTKVHIYIEHLLFFFRFGRIFRCHHYSGGASHRSRIAVTIYSPFALTCRIVYTVLVTCPVLGVIGLCMYCCSIVIPSMRSMSSACRDCVRVGEFWVCANCIYNIYTKPNKKLPRSLNEHRWMKTAWGDNCFYIYLMDVP